jgi:rubrerythrin
MFSLTEIVDIAIRFEQNAIAVYRRALSQVALAEMRTLLEWMVAEEERHATWFRNLRQKVAAPSPSPLLQAANREMLAGMIGAQSFSLKQVDFAALKDLGDLIDVMVEFEKDTILFYEMLVPFIPDPEIRLQLQAIVAEEKTHITRLEAQRPAP